MSAGMPQLDITWYPTQLFWLVICFSVLYFIMARFIVPRIHNVLENRQQRIEFDLDRAASLKVEAEQAREIYEAALSDARAQAQKLLGEVSQAINETASDKNTELDAILNSKIAESERAIDKARQAANRELEPTAAEVACKLVEKLTGDKIDHSAMLMTVKQQHPKAA